MKLPNLSMPNFGQSSLIFLETAGVQRTYNYDVLFPDLRGGGLGLSGGISSVLKTVGGMVEGLAIGRFCQSISIGQYRINDVLAMKAGAYQSFSAQAMDIDRLTATFVVPAPDVVGFYLHHWRRLVVDKDGFHNPTNVYKRNITIMLSGRNGIPSNILTATGAFPTSFPKWELDYNNEGLCHYRIEFSVDGFK